MRSILLIGMVTLASATAARAQIIVTSAVTAPGTTNAPAPTLATSSSFDLSGGNAVALFVTSESGTATTYGATFAGQAMTLGISTNQGGQWAGIFYLLNPAANTGVFVVTGAVSSSGLAYSAIALGNVQGVAGSSAAANTLTSGTVSLNYTTATNGGHVLGAAINNGFNTSSAPAPAFSSSNNADQVLFGPDFVMGGSSGHLHVYGDVPMPGTFGDVYTNRANGGAQRNAYVTLAFNPATPGMATNTFGLVDNGTEFVVDTGAGLAFKVTKSNGSVVSWLYNGTDYKSASGNSSHIASGLGSGGTAVTATNAGNVIVVTIQTDASNGVAANLTHYLIVTNGVSHVYMATYPTAEPGVGELRWITRLNHGLLPAGPVPSNLAGNSGGIESSGDVVGMPDGTTRSKYYGDAATHGKDRALELNYCGASGTNVGVWMFFGKRESSSGGPFFRDILNQAGTDMEIYNYMNSGHCQTEANRLGVLHGPYVLVWNNGATPTLPIDTAWLGNLGLTGWVNASGRGSVSGTASGVQAGIEGVVGLKNAAAQYWTKITNGSYTISGVKPGTYTATLYQGELEVATNSVSVSAGGTTILHLASAWPSPSKVFQIGEWDGTPQGFLNATDILGFAMPNFITMHPSDVRMDAWGPVTFTVGADPPAKFPAIMMRGATNSPTIKFNLTAGQITNLTLKVGATVAYNGGRPNATINGASLGFPGPSSQPNSRSWTVGTYRGNNVLWTWSIPSNNLVVGENTLSLSPVSGSSDLGTWLSAGWVYDCVQLDGPSGINLNPPVLLATYSGGQLALSWPNHAGWTLQMQTNTLAVGLGTNWIDVSGSTSITATNIAADPAKAAAFYRLKL